MPRLFVSFGEALPPPTEVEAERQSQEDAVTEQLDHIARAIVEGDPSVKGFDCTMRHREGWWGQLAVRLLSRMAGA